MPKRDVALLLGDIRTAIDKIERYAARTYARFLSR